MNEIIFVIEEDIESGYTAKALNYSIFTQGDTIEALKRNINDAVQCHFEDENVPPTSRKH